MKIQKLVWKAFSLPFYMSIKSLHSLPRFSISLNARQISFSPFILRIKYFQNDAKQAPIACLSFPHYLSPGDSGGPIYYGSTGFHYTSTRAVSQEFLNLMSPANAIQVLGKLRSHVRIQPMQFKSYGSYGLMYISTFYHSLLTSLITLCWSPFDRDILNIQFHAQEHALKPPHLATYTKAVPKSYYPFLTSA